MVEIATRRGEEFEELTAGLQREHQRVLRELEALDAAAAHGDAKTVRRVLAFFETEMALHRRKEEEVLFPALATLPQLAHGPVACMLAEHAAEALLVDALRTAVETAPQEPGGQNGVRQAATMLVGHLRNHILKEDRVLFPLAEQALSAAQTAALRAGMDVVGYIGRHDRSG